MKERVQKILAEAGVCSRRAGEQLIEAGRVTVNGRKVRLGAQADSERDLICVDGKRIGAVEKKVYIMLHKPRGFVTTLSDERGRKTVRQLIKGCGARVYPVGRLDADSEGLLLLTNDGALTYALTHPRHVIRKVYYARVKGDLKNVERLREPIEIDGRMTSPAEVNVLDAPAEGYSLLEFIIHEGRNRQIRKLCEQNGFEVRRLKRMKIGDLPIDPGLKVGGWRHLTEEEVKYLKSL